MKPITEVWLEKASEDLDVALEIISKDHLTSMVALEQSAEESQ